MRKFNYYMAAFVFAAGVSASLTSCIDTEEPDGIKELRSAKAGYIQAETALKNADASYRDAETAYKQAEVAYKNVETAIKKVEQAKAELDLALREGVQEDSLKIVKAKAQLSLENAVEAYNEAVSNNAEALARVKRQNAEKLAELAAFGDGALRTAAEDVETKQDAYETALATLVDAQKELAKAVARYAADDKVDFQSEIDLAEIGVTAAEKIKADFEELAANKDEQAWVAEWKEYDEAVAAADVKANKLQLEIDKLTDQQTDADQAVQDAKDAIEQVRTDYEDAVIDLTIKIENPALAELIESDWSLTASDVITTSTGRGFYYDFDEKTISYDVDQWGGDELLQKNIKDAAEELRDQVIKTYADEIQHSVDQQNYKDDQLNDTYKNTKNDVEKADGYLKKWRDAVTAYNQAATATDRATKLSDLSTACNDLFGGSIYYILPTLENLGYDTWADATNNLTLGNYGYIKEFEETLAKTKQQLDAYDDAVRIVNDLNAMVAEYNTKDAELFAAETAALEGEEVAKLQKVSDDLQEQIDALTDEQTAINKVKGYQDAYKTTIEGFLTSIDGFDADFNSVTFTLNDEALDQKIAETIVKLDNDIEKAKNAVERAKYNQKLFLDGDYAEALTTDIQDAQADVEAAQQDVDDAKKDLDEAIATYEAIKAKFAE